jgi:histone H3/H4
MSDNGQDSNDKTRFSKPSILRLARKAGIKCISEECYELIDSMIYARLQEIIYDSLHIKDLRGGKVLTQDDIRECLALRGINVPVAHNLSTDKIDTYSQ